MAAIILIPKDVPSNVVTVNSTVRFMTESSTEAFCLTLVYPQDKDDLQCLNS